MLSYRNGTTESILGKEGVFSQNRTSLADHGKPQRAVGSHPLHEASVQTGEKEGKRDREAVGYEGQFSGSSQRQRKGWEEQAL